LPNGLIAAAVRGDRRARDELLALIQPLVLGYCRARLGRQESVLGSADDVAQEVCLAVVSALGSYQPARGCRSERSSTASPFLQLEGAESEG